jgi:hypothetical protein
MVSISSGNPDFARERIKLDSMNMSDAARSKSVKDTPLIPAWSPAIDANFFPCFVSPILTVITHT